MTGREKADRLSQLLKNSRKHAGLTQEQLAGLSTVSVRAIRDLELGHVQQPRKETIRLLADALRLSSPRRAALELAAGGVSVVSTLKKMYDAELAQPPSSIGSFVGRQAELRAVTELLGAEGERLVSVVGLIGVGKTRLALEAAKILHDRNQTPILWVPMGGVADTAGCPAERPQLMLANWVRDLVVGGGSLGELALVIGGRPTLLVLDGFEASAAVRASLMQLLHSCPRLRILVTAREPYQNPGGRMLPLTPLAVPTQAEKPDADWAADQPAMQLMMSHLRHLRPDILPTESVISTMAQICRSLDGLPLALESAASWLLLYAPHQLLEAARRSPLTLTENASATDPDSGAELRRALESSVAGLHPHHAVLLNRLARCREPWTVETAARRSGGTQTEARRGVHALLLRGLIRPVRPETPGAGVLAHFQVLHLVRHLVGAMHDSTGDNASTERDETPSCAI